MVSPKPRILGRLLLDQGRITPEQLEQALHEQAKRPRRLGEILLELFFLEEEALARGLAEQLGLPYVAPPLTADPAATRLLKAPLARQWNVLPLQADARALRLAMADPLDIGAVEDVRFHSGRRVDPVVSSQTAVRNGLAHAYGGEWADLLGQLPSEESPGSEDLRVLERAASAAPIVRMVDHLIREAVAAGASDIHLEPDGSGLRVRHRIDGVLRPVTEIPSSAQGAILSRIKIMARMDIAVKRRPQDGGIGVRHDSRDLTLRVSTVPASGGEKAVLRILDPRRAPGGLDHLGLGQADLTRLRSLLKAGQGVLLSAGPTGSGKSSTLYASLREVDRVRQNVVTLEDPIEYRLEGLTQMQVEPRAGLTFPAALRAVLRQDPDVIMVGEIRDRETAEIAMAAAVTGHLVLSTIHTVDAPGAITRLLDMGVPPFLVAGGLAGVIGQRLVRTVCRSCGGRDASGCNRCESGYAGRTGIFQVLTMTDRLRDEVMAGASTGGLRQLASDAGMGTLAEDAQRKVAEGVTTPHEVGRILHGAAGGGLPCDACGAHAPSGADGCPQCGKHRLRRCRCSQILRAGWSFCPWCLRKV